MVDAPPCPGTGPLLVLDQDQVVADFTFSHPFKPDRIYIPRTKPELVSAIVDGESRGGRMKARGGCYSLSGAQNPDDFLIDTRQLDRYLSHPFPPQSSDEKPIRFPADRMRGTADFGSCLRFGYPRPPDGRYLVHVEAGIGIKRMLADLASVGLGLWTMGSGGSQTLAGAFSTGTHGSDYNLPPLSDFVRALHIVGPGGREWWIEPSAGLIGPAAPKKLHDWCPGTRIVRDDDFFDAALVSVGRLGVIYSVVIEVREDYRLEDRSKEVEWKQVREQLRVSAEKPDAAEVFVASKRYYSATIDLASGTRCFVNRRAETFDAHDVSAPKGQQFLCDDPAAFGLEAMLGAFAAEIEAIAGAALLVPAVGAAWAVRINVLWGELMDLAFKSRTIGDFLLATCQKVTSLSVSEIGPGAHHWFQELIREIAGMIIANAHEPLQRGRSAKILDQHNYSIDHCYSGDSMELFFDANSSDYLEFIDEVLEAANRRGIVPGYVSLRFTAKSRAVLAMEQFDRSVAIEIAVPRQTDGEALYESFMQEALIIGRKHQARPHWGQKHNLTAAEIDALYPRIEVFRWVLAELQGDPVKRTFSSAFTRAWGLETDEDKTIADYRATRCGGDIAASLVPVLF